jgi:hypothetical protein
MLFNDLTKPSNSRIKVLFKKNINSDIQELPAVYESQICNLMQRDLTDGFIMRHTIHILLPFAFFSSLSLSLSLSLSHT